MAVTIQAVAGAIRATKGIKVSHKYASNKRTIGASAIRSTGVYVEKSYGTIVIGFWSGDWHKLYAEQSVKDLAAAIETLRAKGMNVVERNQGYSNFLEVVGA
jgi:hypothetical protein